MSTSLLIPESSPRRLAAAFALLRAVLGTVFVAHGAQKLFVYGLGGVAGSFEAMGVPFPGVTGPLVALVEFLGGLAIVAGLLTRLAAVGVATVMLGAMLLVHLPAGFFLPNGVEFTLMLFTAAVTLAVTGPGAWSLDALVAGRESPATPVRGEAARERSIRVAA